MARNVVATTAKATAKAARASGAGAKRTTAMAVTAAMMMPNGNENNKDGNSKNCFQNSYYHICPFYNLFYHTYASLVVNICHRLWYWREIYPDYGASRRGKMLE